MGGASHAGRGWGVRSLPRRLPAVSLGIAGLAVGLFAWPGAGAALQLEAGTLARGELWRLLTGHLVHWSREHLLWDAGTFLVLGALCEGRGRRRMLAALGLAALAVSAEVLLLQTELASYRGLSGLDCTLFALLAVQLTRELGRRGGRAGLAALAFGLGLLLKIGYELGSGATVFMDAAAAGIVPVPSAHAVGAAIGAGVGLLPKPGLEWRGRRALAAPG